MRYWPHQDFSRSRIPDSSTGTGPGTACFRFRLQEHSYSQGASQARRRQHHSNDLHRGRQMGSWRLHRLKCQSRRPQSPHKLYYLFHFRRSRTRNGRRKWVCRTPGPIQCMSGNQLRCPPGRRHYLDPTGSLESSGTAVYAFEKHLCTFSMCFSTSLL